MKHCVQYPYKSTNHCIILCLYGHTQYVCIHMQIDHMNTIHECAPPFCGTFLISVGSINSSTKENAQCNGHADARNTKEEEVYHDLCAIHRASHSQVFFKTNFLSVKIFAIIMLLYLSSNIFILLNCWKIRFSKSNKFEFSTSFGLTQFWFCVRELQNFLRIRRVSTVKSRRTLIINFESSVNLSKSNYFPSWWFTAVGSHIFAFQSPSFFIMVSNHLFSFLFQVFISKFRDSIHSICMNNLSMVLY